MTINNYAGNELRVVTVAEFIEALKKFPQDMPVGIDWDVFSKIEINVREMESEHGYFEPFSFVNIQ